MLIGVGHCPQFLQNSTHLFYPPQLVESSSAYQTKESSYFTKNLPLSNVVSLNKLYLCYRVFI